MNFEEIKLKRKKIVEKYGDWTASDIELDNGVYTMDGKNIFDPGIFRISQIVETLSRKQTECLKIADLGCLEGGHSFEFAKKGAEVIGVEGKVSNYKKAQFVKKCLDFKNSSFYLDDVRKFTKENMEVLTSFYVLVFYII